MKARSFSSSSLLHLAIVQPGRSLAPRSSCRAVIFRQIWRHPGASWLGPEIRHRPSIVPGASSPCRPPDSTTTWSVGHDALYPTSSLTLHIVSLQELPQCEMRHLSYRQDLAPSAGPGPIYPQASAPAISTLAHPLHSLAFQVSPDLPFALNIFISPRSC
ncbi:hypothetical protein VTK56DRAFT_1753 [Thermocarpiscus australiensis]